MEADKFSGRYYSDRLKELQAKFHSLEPEIEDSDTKQALSVLYGMVQEIWRHVESNSGNSSNSRSGMSLKDVASLYQNAPKMNGKALNKPLSVGEKAPDFSLSDADGRFVKLSDYSGSSVLIVFYPLDWSPGCSQQLDLYQHEWSEFKNRGIKLIGISVDSIYSHGAWAAVRNISFPLLSDFNPKGKVAKMYNVFREEDGFSERALFLVDGDGIIRYNFVSPYLHHIPDIYELFGHFDEIQKTITA
jgi:peroxiredoxin